MAIDREDAIYLKNREKEIASMHEAAAKAEEEKKLDAFEKREAKKKAEEAKFEAFANYKAGVKTTLLTEALTRLCNGSIECASEHDQVVCRNLMGNYVNEQGTTKLLGRMSRASSSILRTIAESVNVYFKKITEEADAEDPESMIIEPETVEDFWKNIENSENVDDITNLIRLRVANAEEEFINKNQEDKDNINNILKDTSERIEASASQADEEYATKVEESETKLAKEKIYQIQHEGYRTTFDKMVRTLSETAMKNPEAGKTFTDGGRLKMDKIVETVRCMYAVLETVSTICLEEATPEFIKATIESIRG